MSMKGYDIIVTRPGEAASVRCRVCGVECRARRNVDGPTGWVAAAAGLHRLHDRFDCPHAGEKWHEQALRLRQAVDACPSDSVRRLMLDDLGRLLQSR